MYILMPCNNFKKKYYRVSLQIRIAPWPEVNDALLLSGVKALMLSGVKVPCHQTLSSEGIDLDKVCWCEIVVPSSMHPVFCLFEPVSYETKGCRFDKLMKL